MQLALQDFGVEVKSVPVGLDVLPMTKAFKPDLIFADVLLAKRNGYEVCAEIKADAETKNIPVVLMWSSFMEVDESRISSVGPDARLEKPFDAETLRQIVQDLVPKTQNNPISAYLQFPKMPEFKETPPQKSAERIPDAAPINFDKFDPTAEDKDSIFKIPEEDSYSEITRMTHELSMIDSSDIDPEKGLMAVAADEEFATVPLNSSQQKDQLEEDGWQRQDLKKFQIQIPAENLDPLTLKTFDDEDFAKKFVIPQDDLDNAHIEVEGEFEEIHFGHDLASPRTTPLPSATSAKKEELQPLQKEALDKVQSKTSPKITANLPPPGGSATEAEMIERVIRDEAREVIESICWKVIPEIAERIVREEINKALRDAEK
jgi:CheY-like chemotaxis protein